MRKIALALTWDGARWPRRSLSKAAQAFLRGKDARGARLPTPAKIAKLLADGEIEEIRVCWVPVLQGGEATLSLPFATRTGKRVRYRPIQQVQIGKILGVIYRANQDNLRKRSSSG